MQYRLLSLMIVSLIWEQTWKNSEVTYIPGDIFSTHQPFYKCLWVSARSEPPVIQNGHFFSLFSKVPLEYQEIPPKESKFQWPVCSTHWTVQITLLVSKLKVVRHRNANVLLCYGQDNANLCNIGHKKVPDAFSVRLSVAFNMKDVLLIQQNKTELEIKYRD